MNSATDAVTEVITAVGTAVDTQQPATSPVIEEASAQRGWWQRNQWALLALIPILAAVSWIHFDRVNEQYWESQPREPVSAGADGWASFAGARIRLDRLEPATDLKTFSNRPFTPPAGVAAWRAVLIFEAPDQEAIGACKLLLEDSDGRTYGASPDELSGARVPFASSCTSDDEPAPHSYESVVYFATPAAAKATAVRISIDRELPRYARLTTSG